MSRKTIFSPSRSAVLAAGLVGIVVTLFTATAVQQDYRQSANDPQIQMAQDAATELNGGASPQMVVGTGKVDLASSLAPFIIVTDNNYRVLASSGQLNGQTILPPSGTFTPDHRFTWQPAGNVRDAAVIETYNNGFVIAARNLSQVEDREGNLRNLALITLIGIVAITAVAWKELP